MNSIALRLLRIVSPEKWGSVFIGGGDFDEVGRDFCDLFRRFGLQSTHDVLDVGCGVGRMALPLSRFITTGSYVGLDVSKDAISLCRKRIKRDNFSFVHADLKNSAYNDSGRHSAATYRFPFADSSFDFVVLCSVFTHLLKDEIENYTAQIARVLKPGGSCFITWFIMDDLERPYLNFIPYRDFFVTQPKTPAAAVAYTKEFVRGVCEKNGLTSEVYLGTWARPSGLTYQDIVVSHKR